MESDQEYESPAGTPRAAGPALYHAPPPDGAAAPNPPARTEFLWLSREHAYDQEHLYPQRSWSLSALEVSTFSESFLRRGISPKPLKKAWVMGSTRHRIRSA